MGMDDFCRAQSLRGFPDQLERVFPHCLKMSYGFGQRGETALWPRLIGSVKTHAAIGTATENATITLGRFRTSRLLFARDQSQHDFFRHGHVFRTLDDRPTVLCRPQATSGLTDSG